jgi:acyl transferase domain-containing protein/non-ribosomal peptide synthetase component F/acyl carrier protein/SAM-dependent methyltransferase
MDFLQYVLQEVKSRRLDRAQALEFVRQFHEGTGAGAAAAEAGALHPLLQRNTSTLSEQRFSTRFGGDEFFLADHVVQGRRVLPGVVHLEMARAAVMLAAELSSREHRVALRDVVFARPVVAGPEGVTVHIALQTLDDGAIAFEVFGDGPDGEPLPFSQGRAVVEAATEAPQAVPMPLQAARDWDAQACYALFARLGLAYGPAHRALAGVSTGQDTQGRAVAVGRLALPASLEAGQASFTLHPSLMDGALQAAIGLALGEDGGEPGRTLLPFAIEAVQVYAPVPAQAQVVVRDAGEDAPHAAVRKLDLDIVGADGRLAVRIAGFSLRALDAQDLSAAADVAPEAGELTLAPVWEAVEAAAGPCWPARGDAVLVLGEDAARMRALQERYPAATLCALDPAQSIEALAERLRPVGRPAHVFWIVTPSRPAGVDDPAIAEDQRHGVLQGLRIVKALLALGWDRVALGFTVLTTQTQAVARAEAVLPAHAGVHGFVGALAKEYPNWQLRLADLPAGTEWPLEALLALPAEAQGQARLYRHGQWHAQRLLPCTLAAPRQGAYRRHGVYVILGGAGGLGEAYTEYLVREYQAQVVWIGRRAEDEAIAARRERIAALGVRPHYIAADAADEAALAAAREEIVARFGAVHGVVHAMIVLADQGIAQMDEARLLSALAPKVDASVHMARVFGRDALDFFLFFSSLQSFAKAAGQSNYAAGCTFVDAYAQALRRALTCPVKVVNWGYWGSVGVVASPQYRARMRRAGLESIEAPEAMALLERLLGSTAEQVVFLKARRGEGAPALGMAAGEQLLALPPAQAPAAELPEATRLPLPLPREELRAYVRDVERCAAGLLLAQLHEAGLFTDGRIAPGALPAQLPALYRPWLRRSLEVLAQQGLLAPCGDDAWALADPVPPAAALRQAWQERKPDYLRHPDHRAHVLLVDAVLQALPAILAGRTPATAVLFPDGSVSAVEGIYKHNRISDYFNAVLAESLLAEVEHRLRLEPHARLRLFEIGAGTGGTSALLFERLAPHAAAIGEYAYTDLSQAFLLHAQAQYLPGAPYLKTRLFNVEQPPAAQGVDLGGYDVVIATNVLHATRDMRHTLRNAKALLKPGGLLLVNEIASFNLFTHLTFGLLEGWWLHTDSALRIPGSPALAPEAWDFLLRGEGFAPVRFPAAAALDFGQQVIAARSDGLVRQVARSDTSSSLKTSFPVRSEPVEGQALAREHGRGFDKLSPNGILSGRKDNSSERVVAPATAPVAKPMPAAEGELEGALLRALAGMVCTQLKLRIEDVDSETSLHELGFDSITLTAFANALNGRFGLELTPTTLFEHPTLATLAAHLCARHRARLLPHFGAGAVAPAVVAAPAEAVAASAAPALAEAGPQALEAALLAALTAMVSAQLKIRPQDIDAQASLNELGFDSITLTALTNALNVRFGLELTPTVLFGHPTLAGLARHLVTEHQAVLRSQLGVAAPTPAAAPAAAAPLRPVMASAVPVMPLPSRRRGRAGVAVAVAAAASAPPRLNEPVAIIGFSGRFPQAADPDELWAHLVAGRDCIGEIPDSRWDWGTLFGDPGAGGNHSNVRHAGVMDGIDEFDPQFFGISPREARSMDPQQRLLMMYVWKAIEDAGYAPQRLAGSRTALLIGTSGSGYANLLQQAGEIVEGYSSTGAVASVGPNRMSFLLDLRGPSEPVETACSSALVAIHRGVELLRSGQCELAIVGGVNTLISPEAHISFNKAGMLSPDGRCRTFSDEANGYVRGEGVGMLVLKPLSAAERDGDRIHAVVRGTAENHGGRAHSLTAPNPRAQADLIKAALAQAGVDPASIGYIEAHGTGTPLGDPIEVQGLKTAFQELAAKRGQTLGEGFCGLGSIKTNIGHLELAAGVAGVIKVLLQMRHRTLVPSLHCERVNRYIDFAGSPFQVVRETRAWAPAVDERGRALPRRAGVSSFGFGGVNAHVVLEEYLAPDAGAARPAAAPGPVLVVLSAANAERLRDQARQLLRALERRAFGPEELADVAYTLQVGRDAMEARLACVVSGLEELRERLARFLEGEAAVEQLYLGEVRRHKDSLAVFTADEELQEALGKWMRRGKLGKLAELWVKGLSLDWAQLYGEQRPRRLGLPTYPFARERYWPLPGGARAGGGWAQAAAGEPPAAGGRARAEAAACGADSDLQALVVQAVAQSLGLQAQGLPLELPLQALGHNSIAALDLRHRLEAALQRPVEPGLTADAGRTVAEIVRRLQETAPPSTPAAASLPTLVPQPQARHEPFPLTDMQEAFLLGRKSSIGGDRIGAHVYVELDVAGALDIFRLNQAWNRLVAQHDMLRAVFEDGRQRVQPRVRDYRFKVVDLRRLKEAERRFQAGVLRETMEHRVFAAEEWPLFDIRVAIHGEGCWRIHFGIDELIVDGLSVDTLLRQWDRLYADPQQAPAALELTFRDYVLATKAFEGSQRYRQDLDYWLQRLQPLPPGPRWPQPAAPQGELSRRRTRLAWRLPTPQWQRLKARAGALGVTPTALVLGVFAEVLRAWTDSPSFTLVLTCFNRPPLHPQMRELVGPAISSLLFVVEPRGGEDFEAIVKAHHQRLWQDLEHSSVSGIQVLRQLRSRRVRDLPQTLPVVFTSMLGSEVSSAPMPHVGEVDYVVNQTPQVFLDHQLRESAAGLECSWDVAEGCFAPGFARALFEAYGHALAGLADGSLGWTVHSFARPDAAVAAPDPVTAQLAQWVAQAQQEDPHAPFALSDQQQAYAFGRDTRLEGGGSSCQYYQALQAQRLDVARLEQALAALLARHPMLCAVAHADGTQAVQAQVPRCEIAVEDLRGLDATGREAALAATRQALLSRVLPLGRWPYFAVKVSLLEDEAACVHLWFDVLMADSSSIGLMVGELVALYEQPQAVPAAPALSFRAWQRAVERFKDTAEHAERLAYWRRKFESLPPGPALPTLPGAAAADAQEHRRLHGELRCWGEIRRCAQALGVAPSLVLLTVYLEVLHAWNGRQPLAVVVPSWERLPVHPDIERVVGDFTALSWVARATEALSFEQRLREVARQQAQDLAQRPVSGLQVLRRVMLKDRRRQPRYPVVFTDGTAPLRLDSRQFALGPALSKTPQVYLDNLSSEDGERLHCSWDFAGGVYAPEMVRQMFDGYLRVLELLGSDPAAWQRNEFDEQIRAARDAAERIAEH